MGARNFLRGYWLSLTEFYIDPIQLSAFYKDFYVQKSKYLKLMPAQLGVDSSSSTTNGRRVTRSLSSSDSGMLWRDRDTSHTSFDNTSNEDGMTTMDMDLDSPQQAKSKGCIDNGGLRSHRGINVADNCNRGDFPEESQRGHSEPITLLNDSDSDSDSDSKVACVALDHSATRSNIAERNRLQLAAETSVRIDNNAENFNESVAQPIFSQTVSVVEILRNIPKSADVLNTSTECKAEHILVPEIVKNNMCINACGESNGNASNVIPDKSDTSSSQDHDVSSDPVTTTTTTTSANVATIAGIIDDKLSEAPTDPVPLNMDHIAVKPISVVGLVPVRKSPLCSITSTLSTSNGDTIPPLKSQRPICRIPLKTVLPCSSSSSRCNISNTDVSATEGLPSSNPSSQESVSLSSSICSTSNGGSSSIQRDTATVCYGKDRAKIVRTAGDSLLTTSVAQTSKISLKRTHTESGISIDATGSNRNHRLPAQGQNKRSNKIDLTDDS